VGDKAGEASEILQKSNEVTVPRKEESKNRPKRKISKTGTEKEKLEKTNEEEKTSGKIEEYRGKREWQGTCLPGQGSHTSLQGEVPKITLKAEEAETSTHKKQLGTSAKKEELVATMKRDKPGKREDAQTTKRREEAKISFKLEECMKREESGEAETSVKKEGTEMNIEKDKVMRNIILEESRTEATGEEPPLVELKKRVDSEAKPKRRISKTGPFEKNQESNLNRGGMENTQNRIKTEYKSFSQKEELEERKEICQKAVKKGRQEDLKVAESEAEHISTTAESWQLAAKTAEQTTHEGNSTAHVMDIEQMKAAAFRLVKNTLNFASNPSIMSRIFLDKTFF
jgi:hypothetical protein